MTLDTARCPAAAATTPPAAKPVPFDEPEEPLVPQEVSDPVAWAKASAGVVLGCGAVVGLLVALVAI